MKARAGCSNSRSALANSWRSTNPPSKGPSRRNTAVWRCACGTNLERSLEQALGQGASALEAIRQESFGREVWIEDPEGNRLLLLEWANEQRLVRAQRRLPRL